MELHDYCSTYNKATGTPISRRVEFMDLTLQGDGEEMAGVFFTPSDKMRIAERLAEAGVKRLGVLGHSPAPSQAEIDAIAAIARRGLPLEMDSLAKTAEELRIAADIGLHGAVILVDCNPTNPDDKDEVSRIFDRCVELTSLSKSLGLRTALMPIDTTRINPDWLKTLITAVEPMCDEITISDSLGVISPWGLEHLIRLVRAITSKPLQVHLHNHTSMAAANALAAARSGASIIHTTVNGIGEFAGLAALEEVAVALPYHLGVETGINLGALPGLSQLVAEVTGIALHPQKPAVGELAFAIPETEATMEVYYSYKKAGRIENLLPYPPRLLGKTYKVSIGPRCNRYVIHYYLDELGLTATEEQVDRAVAEVRNRTRKKSGYHVLPPAELGSILESVGVASGPGRAATRT